jgi:2-oxoglutarate ferredoxin oxidoreductase subunit alpha
MHQQQIVRTNDFAFKLANVNGTGSASANGLLMQAIFRMGIPVSGKNLFPSNIQGLPTWYEIRVNKDGHTARAIEYDLLVAMNVETYARDVAEVKAGGWLLYDSSWPLPKHLHRPDIQFLGVPLAQLCNQAFAEPRERILMKNIAYAGVLVALLDIDMAVIDKLLEEKFGRKKALMDSNHKAIRLGYEYALDNLSCPLPIRLAKMGKDGLGGGEGDVGSTGNADKILIDGNTATALGCVYAGATVAAWYPITPATSVMDGFKTFCEKFRKDPATGKRNFCILQAEDELAAVGMVIGASWNGARAFTSTAGPGISLMSELLGLAYYAEIPAVVIDVQRTGPSTGMPTRTQQADILACAYASHGDTKHILLFPANPSECFHMAKDAFDLAERFQTPVIMLSDLDIGMNDWVTPRLTWDDSYRPNRGKVLTADELEAMAKEGKKFFRYSPADADNVAARTVPGTHAHGAFFTRGSGHNKLGGYTEIPDEYQEVVDRLARKHKSAAKAVPAPVIESQPGARIGVVSLGGCDPAVREGVALLAAKGVKVDYLRVRGFPFDDIVESFLNGHDTNIVIEQNRDGQLRTLLVNETSVAKEKLRSLLVYGGFPLSARHVLDGVMKVVAELAPAEAAAPAGKPAGAPRGEERAS